MPIIRVDAYRTDDGMMHATRASAEQHQIERALDLLCQQDRDAIAAVLDAPFDGGSAPGRRKPLAAAILIIAEQIRSVPMAEMEKSP